MNVNYLTKNEWINFGQDKNLLANLLKLGVKSNKDCNGLQ